MFRESEFIPNVPVMDFILIYWGSFCKELDLGQDFATVQWSTLDSNLGFKGFFWGGSLMVDLIWTAMSGLWLLEPIISPTMGHLWLCAIIDVA